MREFAARVNQIAARLPLAKLCNGCDRLVSFAQETVLHLLLCGLFDKDLQSFCFMEFENGQINSERSLIEFCDNFNGDKQSGRGGILVEVLSKDRSGKNEEAKDEDIDIDMNTLSLEDYLTEDEEVSTNKREKGIESFSGINESALSVIDLRIESKLGI